jgi:hypothetical protein
MMTHGWRTTMARAIRMKVGLLALALGGCASTYVAPVDTTDLADKACAGVTDFAKWQSCEYDFTETVEATARAFRAQGAAGQTAQAAPSEPVSEPVAAPKSDWNAVGSLLLLGGTAFLNGYNQARPVTTTCFTTGMMTQCQ